MGYREVDGREMEWGRDWQRQAETAEAKKQTSIWTVTARRSKSQRQQNIRETG